MAEVEEIHTLEQLLDRMASAGDDRIVCVDHLIQSIGQRSFGPLLLAPSAIIVSPLSGVPGLPSLAAAIIALVAVQMLLGRGEVWLPHGLRTRCLQRRRLDKAIRLLRPTARFVDRLFKPRLTVLTGGVFARLIAGVCMMIALAMPPMEVLPMANSATAAAVATFGLALVTHDGALAIVAFAISVGALWFGVAALTEIAT